MRRSEREVVDCEKIDQVIAGCHCCRLGKGQEAISIIGGADGPTAVFVAGKVGRTVSRVMVMIGGALLAICAIYMIGRRKHKQH